MSLALVLCMILAFSVSAIAADYDVVPISDDAAPILALNDKPLEDLDADPVLYADDTGFICAMVPMRAVIEALGGEISYDASSRLIFAEFGSVTFEFVSGTSNAKVKNSQTGTEADYIIEPAPIFANNRTLIPVSVFEDCFGLVVYDGLFFINVVDLDPLFEEYASKFSIISKLVNAASPKNTLKQTGTYSGQIVLDTAFDETVPISLDIPFEGTFDSLTNKTNVAGSMTMLSELDSLTDLISSFDPSLVGIAHIITMFEDFSLEYIINSEAGEVYFKSPLVNLLLSQYGNFDWLKYSLGDIAVPSSDDFFGIIKQTVRSTAGISPNIYAEAKYTLSIMELMLSDDSFTVSGTDANPVYSLTLDKDVMEKIIIMSAELTGEEIPAEDLEEIDALLDGLTFECNISYAINEKSLSAEVDMNISFDYDGMQLELVILANNEIPGLSSLYLEMSLSEEFSGTTVDLLFEMESTNSYINDEVPASPADDETVLDILDLF